MLLFLIDKLASSIVAFLLIALFLFITDKERFSRKWIWVLLFAVYMNAMLIIVGIPNVAYIRWDPTINWIPFHDFSSSNILGMVLNIIMLIPFGVFLPVYFAKFRKLLPTVLAGVIMSFTMEVLQLFTFRATDVDDLIMNTLGTLLGYFIGALIVRRTDKKEKECRDIGKLAAMVTISIMVVFFVNYPLMSFLFQKVFK